MSVLLLFLQDPTTATTEVECGSVAGKLALAESEDKENVSIDDIEKKNDTLLDTLVDGSVEMSTAKASHADGTDDDDDDSDIPPENDAFPQPPSLSPPFDFNDENFTDDYLLYFAKVWFSN